MGGIVIAVSTTKGLKFALSLPALQGIPHVTGKSAMSAFYFRSIVSPNRFQRIIRYVS